MALKENQPLLYQETKEHFQAALRERQNDPAIQRTETIDKGHGRIEKRSYYLSGEMDWYADRGKWVGLGMARSRVETNGKTSEDCQGLHRFLDRCCVIFPGGTQTLRH